jgi:antitoxin ParD1/3/4
MKVETMNVSLTPEFAEFVRHQVERGLYTTASEVVRDALRLLRERDELHEKRRLEVREKIERGWQQSERGETVDAKTFFDGLKKKTAERTRRRA